MTSPWSISQTPKTTEYNLTFENLEIRQVITILSDAILKDFEVLRNDGEACEDLHPSSPDYRRGAIAFHNWK